MGNEIRLGKVSAVDHPAGMVRVVYHEKDDDVTRMIPILSTVFPGFTVCRRWATRFWSSTCPTGPRPGWSWAAPGAGKQSRRRGRKSCTAWTWTAPRRGHGPL